MSLDGRTLATNASKEARLWDATNGKALHNLVTDEEYLQGVIFAPDGRTVATVHSAGVRFWDVATGREKSRMQGKEEYLSHVALSLDGKTAGTEPPPRNEPPADSADKRPLVVLDPGHGGIDTGTKGPNGDMEKNIVLDFAGRLRDRIEKTGKYRVLMTRTDDTFIPLGERVHMARNAGAALFVSIHADSLPKKEGDAQGATVYTLSETATDSEAARLAEQENRADVIAGVDLKDEPDDVAGILLDLAQRETKTFSVQFAHRLVSELKAATRLHKNPLKSAGFKVLRAPDVPSVLVELGYVSNKDDLQSLLSDTWRDRTAASVAQAIDTYFSTHVAGTRAGAN